MNKIVKLMIDMARFYGYELESRQLEMYAQVLKNFPEEIVLDCMGKYMRNPKNDRFPIPIHKVMADYLPKEPDKIDLAREASSRVLQSVGRFGWPNPTEAREFIGELGWRAVERMGGWRTICEGLGTKISQDSFYAQCRDLCKSTLELGAAGISDSPIGLDAASKKGDLTLVSNLVKPKLIE